MGSKRFPMCSKWERQVIVQMTTRQQILFVDDSAFTLRYHAELAKTIGIDVLTAQGGEKAIQIFEQFQPSLVLCDIMMPDMDGYEVLEILKESKPDIVFYLISAEYNSVMMAKANALGAAGLLTKPLTLEMFQKLLIPKTEKG